MRVWERQLLVDQERRTRGLLRVVLPVAVVLCAALATSRWQWQKADQANREANRANREMRWPGTRR
jgi:membrane-anchored protein YejM (alkaline phosphatase superfamily)